MCFRSVLGFFSFVLIVSVLILYTLFVCVLLAIVGGVLCVFVFVGRSCIVVARVDCVRFGCYLLFVLFAFLLLCVCVLSRLLSLIC